MKIERLIGILSVLLQKNKVTAPYLAEKFEVSRRTINRDIENLCKAGIPIVTTQGMNGGISIMEGYRMDRTLLTSGDMQAILAGLRSLDSVSGTNQYGQLIEKLFPGASDVLAGDQHILINLGAWNKASLSPKIDRIHRAIEGGHTISFQYYSPRGETCRSIEPYYLIFQWSSWYVWGWCRMRKDFRLFKLNRMTDLKVGEDFEKRPVSLPDLSAEKVFPSFYQVKAEILPKYKWRLIDEYGPDCFQVQEDGTLLFSFGFTDKESIVSWILSFGEGARLLEPEEFQEVLCQFGEKLVEKYKKP